MTTQEPWNNLERRSLGPLEPWNQCLSTTVERRSLGTLEPWNLELWNAAGMELWNNMELRSPGTLEPLNFFS